MTDYEKLQILLAKKEILLKQRQFELETKTISSTNTLGELIWIDAQISQLSIN